MKGAAASESFRRRGGQSAGGIERQSRTGKVKNRQRVLKAFKTGGFDEYLGKSGLKRKGAEETCGNKGLYLLTKERGNMTKRVKHRKGREWNGRVVRDKGGSVFPSNSSAGVSHTTKASLGGGGGVKTTWKEGR